MDGGSTETWGDGSSKDMGDMDRGWQTYTTITAWSLVLLGSVLLNATLLIAFIRRPGLRTISNRFVMNLIASNLLAIFVLTTLLITNTCQLVTYSWNPSICALSEGATALVTTSSILSVLLIGIDQYSAVVDPLRYRTRIDKLKCGLLILAAWLIALAFGILASFNPQPRGLWKLCSPGILDETSNGNGQQLEQDKIREMANKTTTAQPAVGNSDASAMTITYGMVYALVYAFLGYLVPFAAMCWIYVSIYMAARNNSERTRRNGSRPVLTSGSFSEEGGHRPADAASSSLEDVRRIPKISSLSSIDENSEASPSQAEPPVIFTVGSSGNQDDSTKVPSGQQPQQHFAVIVEGDVDEPSSSRKNSQDLAYEEMMLGCKHPYEYEEDDDLERSSDEEEEDRHHREFEPLSSADRPAQSSVSVNFDLGDSEHSRMLDSQPTLVHGSSGQSPAPPPPIVTITPPVQKGSPVQRAVSNKSTHSYISNIKHRISNGSLFKYREETRAARVSALVIVMGLICWTPYVYVLLLRNLQSLSATIDHRSTADVLDARELGFLVLATYVSPLLFGYRSKRVKRELRKFFCFKRELSYKNNRSLMAKKVLRRKHSGVTILGQLAGEANVEHSRYNIFNCVVGKNRWPKEKVQFVQVPDTALAVETCRSSFSSGASTQISSTSTDEC